jgi:pimeloyl-[acyl-carrier protein] methyl ester esterase
MPAVISLVMLPGMDGTGRLFEPFLANLPESWTPVVVRYPADRPLGYADLLPLVEAELPANGQFVILAESFSGPIAVRLAARRNPRLVAVVLVASFDRFPRAAWLSQCRWLVRSIFFQLPLPAWGIRRFLAGDDATAELVAAVQAAVRTVSPAVMARRAREILAIDARDSLPCIGVPVLAISGSRDRLVPRENVEDLRILGNLLATETLDAPHLVLQRQPAESARVIEKFLERRIGI